VGLQRAIGERLAFGGQLHQQAAPIRWRRQTADPALALQAIQARRHRAGGEHAALIQGRRGQWHGIAT